MELTVDASILWNNETSDADTLGATLRLFSVANLDEYASVTTPQDNLTASIPWSRAARGSVGAFSALGYYFAAEMVKKHPSTPIGVLASDWGGTAIQPWMSPESLALCKSALPAKSPLEMAASADPATSTLGRLLLHTTLSSGRALNSAFPTNNSVLFNSMIAPLLKNPKRLIGWYQGESVSILVFPYISPPPSPPLNAFVHT